MQLYGYTAVIKKQILIKDFVMKPDYLISANQSTKLWNQFTHYTSP